MTTIQHSLRMLLVALIVSALVCCLPGCATTEPETSMPWNTPQSWEGSPAFPMQPE